MIFLILLIAILALVGSQLAPIFWRKLNSKQKSDKEKFIDRLQVWITNNRFLQKYVHQTAKGLNKINGATYARNVIYASFVWLGLILLAVLSLVLSFVTAPLWYMGVIYAVISIVLEYLAFLVLLSWMDSKFSQMMPSSFKYLSSRFLMDNDIMRAIELSALDSEPPVKKLLDKIYNAFKTMNLELREEQLQDLETEFQNRYATILITLIKSAYSRGGGEVINEQLEELTEQVYFDIDNERDIFGAGRAYMVSIAGIVPFSLSGLELMSEKSLGSVLGDFYVSPKGYVYKIMILLGMLAYIGVMRYVEEKKVV
jgi:Flp pilus assembly protein TadB